MQLAPDEAHAIALGLSRISKYYVPDGAAPEWLLDHMFCVGQIAGVVIARKMRQVVVPLRQAPAYTSYQPGDIPEGA